MLIRDINWEIWCSLTLNMQHLWVWKMNESNSNWIEDIRLLQASYYTAPSVRMECWINNFTLWLTYEMMFRMQLIGYKALCNSNIMQHLMIVLLLIHQLETLATPLWLIHRMESLLKQKLCMKNRTEQMNKKQTKKNHWHSLSSLLSNYYLLLAMHCISVLLSFWSNHLLFNNDSDWDQWIHYSLICSV